MRICEVFASVQGEGVDIGLPTVFVRTVGCNLRCGWCDTKYAYEGGSEWGLERLEKRISSFGIRRACLTGGEPLLQPEAPRLVAELLKASFEVSVETNGSLPVGELIGLDKGMEGGRGGRLRVSMDVKCPSSKMHGRMRLENLADLRERDQVKFVLRDLRDYAHAREVLRAHPTRASVVLQPVWGRRADRIVEAVLRDRLDARVLVQLHKVLWGVRARGR